MLLALAVNIGMWYDTDSGLQKAADLSALAGAQYLETGGKLVSNPSYPCTAAANAADPLHCATLVAGLNGIATPETANAQFVDQNGVADGVEVTTRHPNESGLFFSSTRTESATALVGGIAGASNSFPATFPAGSWKAGQHISWPFGSAPQPGAFNMLNTCGGNGTKTLETCFECAQTYSYDAATKTLTALPNSNPNCTNVQTLCAANNQFGSDPGNTISNPNVVQALNTLAGKIVLVPVYTSAQGNGSNATYTVGGFAAILLDNPAATAVGTPPNQTVNLSGTFETAVGPTGAGTCGGASGNYGITTVYLTG
jgi:hypothetical protein